MSADKIKVLFVCMGNICRSPTAEGVFRAAVERANLTAHFHIDSAGTHSYHLGHAPDKRSQAAILRRGIDIGALRSRLITPDDLQHFDYVILMDDDNMKNVNDLSRRVKTQRATNNVTVALLLDYAELAVREVPDPYYGNEQGFEEVLDLIEAAANGLLQSIVNKHKF
ncbi:MAG: low molecular weight phosphotyrosine protein phosphatase [Gammaproteobacteria bacterium]|nr:low molecular weight phosphotyrosine protein phosphatase [Gammaproteobacteria bacterium]